jgi:hypothetical protein
MGCDAGVSTEIGTSSADGDDSGAGGKAERLGELGGGAERRASRMAPTRSTSCFDLESKRVNRNESPGSLPIAAALYAMTRPSPRSSGAPDASANSKRKTTPSGRGCAPTKVTPVREIVSSSRAKNSSSV